MLVGCITGPDFPSVKKQLEKAQKYCDAVEIRADLFEGNFSVPPLVMPMIDCKAFPTVHNFDETPEDLEAMVPKGEFVKIATMARCITDSLRMLKLVKKHRHIAGMCMGPYGAITRILAPIYGSPMTFTSLGKEAALGQIDAEELVMRYRFRELTPSTQVYGLMGNPVSQSPSHEMHNAYFQKHDLDAIYVKMEVQDWELPLFFELVKELNFKGLSITIPYKEQVLPYIACLSKKAEAIGAVNTLSLEEGLLGDNTDGDGALDVVERRMRVLGKKIAIVGAGGSAKAIAFEAKRRGGIVTLYSRRFNNLHHIPRDYEILINTIPVSIDYDPIPGSIVFDINFNREKSPLMDRARQRHCQLIFGEEMFQAQAQLQFSRWGQIPSL